MSNLSTTTVIYTHLDLEGCTAELLVNDIPVSRLVAPLRRVESIAAQQYLHDGVNRLELLIEPGKTPARARSEMRDLGLDKAKVTGRLVRYPDGVDLTPAMGTVLMEVSFRSDELSGKTATYPRSVHTEKDLGPLAGRWPFEDAPVLIMDEALVAEARAVLEEVASAIRMGNTQQFLDLLRDQHADVARAYPALTMPKIREDIADYLAYFKDSKEPVLPLTPEKHSFRLVAGGRLLHCLDTDWEGCVRMKGPDDGISPYPLFLARLGGQLRIVR